MLPCRVTHDGRSSALRTTGWTGGRHESTVASWNTNETNSQRQAEESEKAAIAFQNGRTGETVAAGKFAGPLSWFVF